MSLDLARLLRSESLPKIRSLDELNRIQPEVKIVGIQRGALADEVLVDVEVAGKKEEFDADEWQDEDRSL